VSVSISKGISIDFVNAKYRGWSTRANWGGYAWIKI